MNLRYGALLVLAIALVNCSLVAAEDWESWPPRPIEVSPVEGLIECFWLKHLHALRRWTSEDGRFSTSLDATFLHFKGATSSMTRSYDLNLGDYQRLIVRLTPGEKVRTTITAVVDGQPQTIVRNAAGSNRVLEFAGSISGKKLSQLTLRFTASEPGEHKAQLRWILLDKPGSRWNPPEKPFEDMIVERTVNRFQPGLGILLGADEIRRMRERLKLPVCQATWQGDQDYAARQYQVDPLSLLRPYSLYVPSRYGRKSDESIPTSQDGIMLALVGLLTENEDYLRRAAQQAIVLAQVEHWAEGFVSRVPGYPWNHSSFAPNTATIKAALLLDWTWHYLTPRGRTLIRKAIKEKGLARVWHGRRAMANQGVRFNKGLILGKMALADSFDDPQLRRFVQDCLDRINPKLQAIVRTDGSFSEGFDYGSSTLTSTLISYQAASRCLGRPINELASPRILPAMRHVLLAKGELNPVLAAFCAGPLDDRTFESQCVPSGLLYSHDQRDHPGPETWPWWPLSVNRTEYCAFGLQLLWAPSLPSQPSPPRLPRFFFPVAQARSSDTPPVYGGKSSLDAGKGAVNVGADQDYLRDVSGATVSAWIKVSRSALSAQQNYIYQSSGRPSSRLQLQVRGRGTSQDIGTLAAYIRRVDGDASASLFSAAPIAFDRWVHVALAVDYVAGRYSFFMDGANAGSGSTGLSFGRAQDSATPQNWVGAGGGRNPFPGLIDDLRVYRKALLPGEIKNHTDLDLALHYTFEGSGPRIKDLARADGTASPIDDGDIAAASGWVFMGNDDSLAPRWSFESGLWDMHGHAWKHKHSLTLRAGGEKLLIERDILPYEDARSEYTQKTRAYNVFSPAERDQSPQAGCGGRISVAEDLESVVVIESDNATAWARGVRRAVRRAIMFRPGVMVVHDDVLLDEEETGVQNWTSLRPWQSDGRNRCLSRRGNATVRLHGILPHIPKLVTGEDSVSDERQGIVPVYRAAFISPASKRHELLTIIEAIMPNDTQSPTLKSLDDGGVELRQGSDILRVFAAPKNAATSAKFGFTTDGVLLFVMTRADQPMTAGAFDATWLKGPELSISGDGFVHWRAASENKEP
tara:strand:+ start:578 stop:3850 length:3273 start_codon:yes stop_codon:yes gene_type:complete